MKVYVNDMDVQIFRGARAKHAILRFLSHHDLKPKEKEFEIKDAWGNTVSEDYPMREEGKIFIE